MSRDISLTVSIKDGFSAPLSKASGALSKLRQEAEQMGAKIDALNRKKVTVSVETTRVRQELKAATAAFDETKAAADRLEQTRYQYEALQTQLQNLTSEAEAAEKQLSSLHHTIQQQETRPGTGKSGGGLLSSLKEAGASKIMEELASQAVQVYVSSAFGGDAATLLSAMVGSGLSGASIGSMIAPGIGTAIGAGVGSLVGAVSGGMQLFQKEDEFFKSLVQEKYQQYQQEMQQALTSGSATAASREESQRVFSGLMDSDTEAAALLDGLSSLAASTSYSQAGLETASKALMINGLTDREKQLEILTSVGQAGSALGFSEQSMAETAAQLGQIYASQQVSLTSLAALVEQNIPAFDYLAENLGKSKEEVYEMVEGGLIPGAEAAEIIADAMGNTFAGPQNGQADTYNSLAATLKSAQDQLDAAMGEGYNEARKPAMQAQIDYLSGEGGDQLKEMYALIGEFQASVENEKERAIQEAMETVTQTEDYQQAMDQEDGAQMGRLLMEAKANAEQRYLASAEYDLLYNGQKSSIEAVQDNLAPVYENAGHGLMEKFNEGLLAAQKRQTTLITEQNLEILQKTLSYGGTDAAEALADDPAGQPADDAATGSWRGHAAGLQYVPYDGYRAILHEGERVLTAREAREAAGGVTVSVTGNYFTVREEADVDRIAETLARKITEARRLLV